MAGAIRFDANYATISHGGKAMFGDTSGHVEKGRALGGVGPDFGGFRKFDHLALLIVDEKKEIEISNGRSAAGALDDRLPPRLVVRFLRRLDRRPDIDPGPRLAVEFEEKMLAQQFLVRLPFRNHVARFLRDLPARPAFRGIEFDQLEDH